MVLSNRLKTRRVLPGFGLSLGFTLFYLSLIVLIPLSTLVFKTSRLGWARLAFADRVHAGHDFDAQRGRPDSRALRSTRSRS